MALTRSQVISVAYGSCRMDVEEGWKLIKVDDGFTQLTGYTKERVFKDRVVYSQLVHTDDMDLTTGNQRDRLFKPPPVNGRRGRKSCILFGRTLY